MSAGSTPTYFGLFGSPTEQKPAFSVTAEGVFTIVRKWKGTIIDCQYQQSIMPIRGQMPALNLGPSIFPTMTARCIDMKIDAVEAAWYTLTATFQGYVALPFEIYRWESQRLDRPIQMHPRFDNGSASGNTGTTIDGFNNVMQKYLHWAPDPITQQFNGFTPYLINSGNPYAVDPHTGQNSPNLTTTANPYRGIEAYEVATGSWHRTSFSVAPNLTNPPQLWKATAPNLGPYATGNPLLLPDPLNAGDGTTTIGWIKSQEDLSNLYRGASELWQLEETYWYNGLGWRRDIYSPSASVPTY